MNSAAIAIFLKKAVLQRQLTEQLQELDAARKLVPASAKAWLHKHALLMNARSDIATNCRVLRLYYQTHGLQVIEA